MSNKLPVHAPTRPHAARAGPAATAAGGREPDLDVADAVVRLGPLGVGGRQPIPGDAVGPPDVRLEMIEQIEPGREGGVQQVPLDLLGLTSVADPSTGWIG